MKALKIAAVGLALTIILVIAISAQNNPGNPGVGKATVSSNPTGNLDGMVFEVKDPMNRNSVTFKSTAPLEDIVGTSNQVTGYLVFDPTRPEKGGHGELVVPVKSLRTGIPLRDEHLAGADWINAEENPNITFKIAEVQNVLPVRSTAEAKTFDVTVGGSFALNGVTRHLNIPARITYLKESDTTKQRLPGDLLAARTTFDLVMADFGIKGPEGMKLIGSRVGEKVIVDVSVIGSSAGNPTAGNPCAGKSAINPCGDKGAMNPCNPCGGK